MALTTGTRLGAYVVGAPLGSGGIGEVYRARDTRLDRTVAIKVLRDTQPDRQARLAREARIIAALAHPNICTLFDIGHEHGTDYLVMELLEGETLAARLAGGPLTVAEALHVAVQMASALDAAHRASIVHRDLKPANVFLVRRGGASLPPIVKLLDFGIAKLPVVSGETITTPGLIMGTVQYMAPEQFEGRDADARTDVFALGALLYEMLTGTKAFAGPTQTSVIAAILDHEPASLASVLPSIPAALDRVVRKCLAKDPDERWQTTRDLASELRWIEQTSSDSATRPAGPAAATTPRQAGLKARLYTGAAVLAALAIGALASALYFRRWPADAPEMRVQIPTPGGGLASFAMSPDGRTLVFVGDGAEGKRQLWLRQLDTETTRPLAGTDDPLSRPFWSPDSRSIGFFADGLLKRIEVAGGPPVVLARAPSAQGGSWNLNGEILFTPQVTGPIHRISARGGESASATQVNPPGTTGHWHPFFLPDGRHFLFFGWGTPEQKGVYLGSLDSTATRRLFDATSSAVFAPPDRVLYARQGALVAQRLNTKAWEPIGDPLLVATEVAMSNDQGALAAVSSSAGGPLVYRAASEKRQLVWVDQSGREMDTVGAPYGVTRSTPVASPDRLSPDGRTLAITLDADNRDIWLFDLASGVPQRFTFGAASKMSPIWSPNGRRLVFSWDPKGILDLYEKPVDGADAATLLWSSSEHKNAVDWSPDGRVILYGSANAMTGWDLWALPLVGDRKPFKVAQTAFNETGGRFSPDGRLVVYQSNETGQNEIYIQAFPGPDGKKQVTSGGGFSPHWGHDSRELRYVEWGGRHVMAVPITTRGTTVEAGKAVAKYTLPPLGYVGFDGQRFLMTKIVSPAAPLTLLLNWKSR